MKIIKFVVFAFYVFIFSSCFLKIESHILNYNELDIIRLNNIYSNNYHGIESTVLLKKKNGNDFFNEGYESIPITSVTEILNETPIFPLISFSTGENIYYISFHKYSFFDSNSNNCFWIGKSDIKAMIKINDSLFMVKKQTDLKTFSAGLFNWDINSDLTYKDNDVTDDDKFHLAVTKDKKVIMTLCKNNINTNITYYLFKDYESPLFYSHILFEERKYSCNNCQTIEIIENNKNYIISCLYEINYGITCVSHLIQEKIIVLNQERVIGICNTYRESEPKNIILLSYESFGMIGCGTETKAEIVKIDKNLNQIGSTIIFEVPSGGTKFKSFDFLLKSDYLYFIYLTQKIYLGVIQYETYYQSYYIPKCESTEIYLAQNTTYDFTSLKGPFIKFYSYPNYMKTVHPECRTKGCRITNENPLYLYGSDYYLDSLNFTIEYILLQEELEDSSKKCTINIINCYKTCLSCKGIGNEINNNCTVCRSSVEFRNFGWNQTYLTNCMNETEGYYHDYITIKDKEGNEEKHEVYRLCHPRCKTCLIEGNYTFPNCYECATDLGYYPISSEDSFQARHCYLSTDNIPGYYFRENKFYSCQSNCIQCSLESMSEYDNDSPFGCEVCNYKKDYYPLYLDSKRDKANCISYEKLSVEPYYLIGERYSKDAYLEKCYYTCQTCSSKGNQIKQNCLTCAYDFIEDIEEPSNCFCYYYINNTTTNQYKCVTQCDFQYKKINLYNQIECIEDCFRSKYKYIYNYQCFDECPNGTYPNSNNECFDGDKCVIHTDHTILKFEDLNDKIFQRMVLAYINQFLNSNIHTKYIISEDKTYKILIYKNFECLKYFRNYSLIKVYFGENYDNLQKKVNISNNIDVITLLIDIDRGDYQPHLVQYYIYHPFTGDPISNIDKKELYYNVTMILPMEIMKNVDYENAIKFQKFNFNVFNKSEIIFTNMCQNISELVDYDVILKDRIKDYYQNILFSNDSCTVIGINYDTFEVNCTCFFQPSLLTEIYFNVKREKNVLNNLNILTFDVLKCTNHIKNKIFSFKISIIIFVILLMEILCFFIYLYWGIKSLKEFLGGIIGNPPIKIKNNNSKITSEIQFKKINKFLKNIHTQKIPSKNNLFKYEDINNLKDNNTNDLKLGNIIQLKDGDDYMFLFENDGIQNFNKKKNNVPEKKTPVSEKVIVIKNNENMKINNEPISIIEEKTAIVNNNQKLPIINEEVKQKINNDDMDSNLFYSLKDLEINDTLEKNKINELKVQSKQQAFSVIRVDGQKYFSKIIDEKKEEKRTYAIKISKNILFDNNRRLNDFKYSAGSRLDKRTFCDLFNNQIMLRENFYYTFCYYNPLQPKLIRVIILLFKITFCFLINTIFFPKNYFSDKYNLREKNTIKFYFRYAWIKIIVCLLLFIIIDFLLHLTRNSSNKIIYLYHSMINKKQLILQEYENIKFQNILLSIIIIIITGYTCFHTICFCFVYKFSQIDLFFGSILTFLFGEIFQILFTIFICFLRIFAIKHNSECAYNFSAFFIL